MNKNTTFGIKAPHHFSVHVVDGGWLLLHQWHHDGLAAPYWRFYWNENGGASVLLHGRRTQLDPARCFLIPPQTPFSARLSRPVWHFCLHFVTGPSGLQLAPGIYGFPRSGTLLHMLAEIRARLRTERESTLRTSLLCLALVHEALYRLPIDKLTFGRSDERVDRAVRIMEGHLSTPLPTTELARRLGLHFNTFTRLFKRGTGHPPWNYYNHLRIQRAVLLLLSTSFSIKEIAEETGFCDRYHFSRAFARRHGVGPAKFRLMHTRTRPTTLKKPT